VAQQPEWHSYAAKFVCGSKQVPPAASLAPGVYKTMVSIHNPNYLMDVTGALAPVIFFKKVILTLPQGQQPLPPSCKVEERLWADHALFMDCSTIKGHLGLSGLPNTGSIEGFVVIEVGVQPDVEPPLAPPLDVVATYAGRPSGGMLNTLDVERIPATKAFGLPLPDPCDPMMR
jgi:hypothetical protein